MRKKVYLVLFAAVASDDVRSTVVKLDTNAWERSRWSSHTCPDWPSMLDSARWWSHHWHLLAGNHILFNPLVHKGCVCTSCWKRNFLMRSIRSRFEWKKQHISWIYIFYLLCRWTTRVYWLFLSNNSEATCFYHCVPGCKYTVRGKNWAGENIKWTLSRLCSQAAHSHKSINSIINI